MTTSASSVQAPREGHVLIVVEGKSDRLVLAEFLVRMLGFKRPPRPEEGADLVLTRPSGPAILRAAPNGKSGLAKALVKAGSAQTRPSAALVIFDPDTDPRATELDFLVRDLRAAAPAFAPQSPPTTPPFPVPIAASEVPVHCAAWRAPLPARWNGLDDSHSLERVLLGGILASIDTADAQRHMPDLRAWAERATSDLCSLVPAHGWKRAFRIWGAALGPDVEPETTLFERLLQQEPTKAACLTAIADSEAGKTLSRLLGMPASDVAVATPSTPAPPPPPP